MTSTRAPAAAARRARNQRSAPAGATPERAVLGRRHARRHTDDRGPHAQAAQRARPRRDHPRPPDRSPPGRAGPGDRRRDLRTGGCQVGGPPSAASCRRVSADESPPSASAARRSATSAISGVLLNRATLRFPLSPAGRWPPPSSVQSCGAGIAPPSAAYLPPEGRRRISQTGSVPPGGLPTTGRAHRPHAKDRPRPPVGDLDPLGRPRK